MNKEIWKDIKGYEGLYKISNYGNVSSLPRKGTRTSHKRIKLLGNNKVGRQGGYLLTSLSKNNKLKTVYSHRLVAQHFIPNPNLLKVVNHIDGNTLNNRVENLEWCTHSQNMAHAYRIGLRRKKTSDSSVEEIKRIYKTSGNQLQIANKFGISQSMVSLIVNNKRNCNV